MLSPAHVQALLPFQGVSLAQSLTPHLLFIQDHGGVIINITATLGYRGQALQVHAGTAKAAIGIVTHLANLFPFCISK